jgi:hypothetical protein
MSHAFDPAAEEQRLAEDARRERNWKRWGPYLSERQWGTVREDYSANGTCWDYFPHDHARSRAYRWGEDGLLGITDRECRLCFAIALWNGRDPILKERLFGLTGPEGNHGEDVKEEYYYLDSTPTHSYMKAIYKYPQYEFPYSRLLEDNRRRGRALPELELADLGVFEGNRYFDVCVEYAKATANDILIRLTLSNRGPEPAVLHVLPTLWFRNTWSWGCTHEGCWVKPRLWLDRATSGIIADHATLERFRLFADKHPASGAAPDWLFTDNETNSERLFGGPSPKHPKDAFHSAIVGGDRQSLHANRGTKAACHYVLSLAPGQSLTLRARLASDADMPPAPFGDGFDSTFAARIGEADAFYDAQIPPHVAAEPRAVIRQAAAGLLWSKQFYHYVVEDWLAGDPDQPPPPAERHQGRNRDWRHVFNRDILSMPDKWEYPWYAAWDLAFHMLPMARVDPQFAKDQLVLMLREWYMHPNGQIPAYEFAFDDVNPPVHAWACWRVYKMTGQRGERDLAFLSRVFHKLIINFTWWVNRKDKDGNHLFSGGFLGLDNIGVFDRSQPLPTGGHLQQADGTAWMAFYCATMLAMALELADHDRAYEDVASKFFEHFVAIADAMNRLGGTGLWDEEDGFYYDQIRTDGESIPLRIRSMVGLIPLFAVEVLEEDELGRLPGFRKRLLWFLENRRDLAQQISYLQPDGTEAHGRRLLAIPSRDRLVRVLRYLFDENEFLSPYGVRSLSRVHRERPFVMRVGGQEHRVAYDPAESTTGLFGGNSNWRGPIWFPVNFLLCEALERYHHFYGPSLEVEFPTGSGRRMSLGAASRAIGERLARLFLPDPKTGRRPCFGADDRYANDPHYRGLLLFHEYFDGDSGRGLGASHQTGWTALAARFLHDLGRPCE